MANNGFIFKKEISISHIFTFIMLLGSVGFLYGSVASRMAIAETKIASLEYNFNRLEQYLIRIESKLDSNHTK